MVRVVVQQTPAAIQLLEDYDSGKLVRESQARQRPAAIRRGDEIRRKPIGAADETNDIGMLSAPVIEVPGHFSSRPLFAAFVERYRKSALRTDTTQAIGLLREFSGL